MVYGIHATKVIDGPAEARFLSVGQPSDKSAGGIFSGTSGSRVGEFCLEQ
jgi:hypothetical protein